MDDSEAASPSGPRRTDRLLKAKEIFLRVRSLEGAARSEELEGACGGDPVLRDLVHSLLKGDHATVGLEGMAKEFRTAIDSALGEAVGAVIGPYTLVRQIGEGGFGSVFLAEQSSPVHRTVALKILKIGMDTREVVARFERERQALAVMDHPSIAKVFDAGATQTGRPYFVMEYCTGVPITEYCDERRLSIRARLDLFSQICGAIQHAHQKGVIHRDIKPGNVLVEDLQGTPHAKVIDFGIAKSIERRLTDCTVLTEHHQFVGTPEYMSPEQAEGGVDIDTRTDVYSLGVLLYELLAGSTPLEPTRLRSAALGEVQRIIREIDPPAPSVRLRTLHERAGSIASDRATPVAALVSTLRGDLDWIVMKALDKDRGRRYDSAGSMARDVQRFLSGEAVHAAPPSAVYRVRKFARRHRGPVIAASLLAVSLVAGLVGTGVGFINARAQRAEAVAQAARAQRQTYLANIGGAIDALDAGQVVRASERLRACPESHRGWEWSFARRLEDVSVRVLTHQQIPGLMALDVDCSPDGRSIVTPWCVPAAGEFGACIADAQTGRPRVILKGHAGEVRSARYSPDGTRVVTASHDGSVRLFDAVSGVQTGLVHSGQVPMKIAVFDASGDRIVAIEQQQNVFVFDAATLERLASLGGRAFYSAFGIPGDHRIVLTRGFDGPLLWNPGTSDSPAGTLAPTGDYRTISALVVPGPSGDRLAVSSPYLAIRMVGLPSGRIEASMRGHTGTLTAFAFSPDGHLLASASEDGTVRIWETATGDLRRLLLGHKGYSVAVDFSPDGSRLYSAGNDGVRVWNVSAEQDGSVLFSTKSLGFSDLRYIPDGTAFLTADEVYGVRLFDSGTLAHLRTVDPTPAWSCALAGDGGVIAVGGIDGTVGLVKLATGERIATLPTISGGISCMEMSPDARRLCISSWDHTGTLYDVPSGTLIARLEGFDRRALAMCFSPDSSEVIASSGEASPARWSARDGARLGDLPIRAPALTSIQFGPGGVLLTAGGYSPVALWDPRSGQLIREFRGHEGILRGAAFLPDGSRIVTTGRDGTVRLWDPDTGDEVAVLRAHRPFVQGLCISPDGTTIAVHFEDQDAQFFRTTPISGR